MIPNKRNGQVIAFEPLANTAFSNYLGLSQDGKEQFIRLLNEYNKTMGIKAAEQSATPPTAQDHYSSLLYDRIAERFKDYRGINLPGLDQVRAIVEADLHKAMDWLRCGAKSLDRPTLHGLVDLAADAVVREWHWIDSQRAPKREELLARVRDIPGAVDRAFPGYRHNNILLQVAKAAGSGGLPVQSGAAAVEDEWEEQR